MKGMLGIRREDRNPYERRAPLTPGHVKDLIANLGVEVRIQPSDIRVFSDGEYAEAGAVIQEDLSECALVLAVKEIPVDLFREGGTYMFFSHTIKGQEYNMPMLCRLMELKCQLIDYEKVTDDKNRRLIFFGREAGLAGMLNTLWALGGRLEWEGHKTAFREIAQTSNYMNLAEAREAVRQLGAQISAEGVPQKVGPVICGFAGYGNVSRGAQEIYDMLPVEVIRPRDLLELGGRGALANLSRKKVYKVVFKEEDMVEPASSDEAFDLQHYYEHPEKYRGIFTGYLPYLTMLVNCIYWDERYPRLVTLKWLKFAYPTGARPKTALRVIGDISCDIGGSVECTVKPTDPGDPIYVYDPAEDRVEDGWAGNGPVVMAVDALPSSIPEDATRAFGDMLMPHMPGILRNDFSAPLEGYKLPPPVRRALILHQGKFTEEFEYMENYLK